MQLGNGLAVDFTYDADGRLTGIDTGSTVPDIQDLTLAYDAASRITGITDGLDASRTQSFAYDGLSRLTDATGAYGDIDYAYDAGSNRTSRITDDGVTTTVEACTIAAGSNRLLSLTDGTGTRSLSYDSSGNITGDTRLDGTVFAYDYDHAGRLSEVTRSGSTDVTYLHDNLGHRVAKLSNVPGIASAHYLHGLAGGLLAEASTTGVTTTEYLWLDGLPLVLITDANTASPRIHWVHTDHLGTPQKLTDSTGAVVWDAVATPFGERASVTGSLTQPLRLPGQYADLETGLHQNWWRDYDPTLGRYIQADPIGLAGGSNLYGYANADPLRFTDPDGRVAGILVGPIVRAGIGRAAGQAIASALRNGLGEAGGSVAGCLLVGICTNEMSTPDDPGQEAADEAEPEQCEPEGRDPCEGLRRRLREHEQKLANYVSNPMEHDNMGYLQEALDQDNRIRFGSIYSGRISNLVRQIDNFRRQLRECEKNNGR